MPEFRMGKGIVMRLCESCGEPFQKTSRGQKNCPDCKRKNIMKRFIEKNKNEKQN